MGRFSIQNQAAGKKLAVKVEGTFQPQDAKAFIDSFAKETSLIPASQYELAFDCSKLDVSPQNMVPTLQGCLELYKKMGFKKITINTYEHVILRMQLQKLVSAVRMENTTVV